jgi:hypothetical protein
MPALVGLAAAAVFAAARSSLVDDSYITLSYARNLARDLHWGLIADQTSNTATSPLNVIVLAGFVAVLRDAILALGVVFVLCTVVTAVALRMSFRAGGLPAWLAPLTTGLLLVNPLLLASIGLEVTLGAAGIAVLLACARPARPVAFGVVTGLLALVRLDLVLMAMVLLVARPRWWVGWWRGVLVAVLVALPWFAWSWAGLGSAVPDTLIIKMAQHSWGQWGFANGPLLYAQPFPTATLLSFAPAVLGVVAAVVWAVLRVVRPSAGVRRLDPFVPLAVAGVVHYVAYARLGVPPYHWYYGPSIVTLTMFLASVIGAIWVASTATWVRGVAAVLPAVLLLASAGFYGSDGIPRRYAPITTNHASSAEYARIGADLARLAGDRTVRSAGEIGALAYYCECDVVDAFSDRGEAASMIMARGRASGPIGRRLLDLNFFFLERGMSPRRVDLVLIRTAGAAPAEAIGSWRVDSPWAGGGTLYVIPAA